MPIRKSVTPLQLHRILSCSRQREIARATGINQQRLSSVELGFKDATPHEAFLLSRVLKVPVEVLFPDGKGIAEPRRRRIPTPPLTIPRTMDIFLPAPHEDGK